MSKSEPLPKQVDEKFCHEYIKTGVASYAFLNSRKTKKGARPETAWERGCVALAKPHIAKRIHELQLEVQEKTLVTVASLTAELELARKLAMDTSQPAAVTSAVLGKAKLNGLDVKKVEISGQIDTDVRVTFVAARLIDEDDD